MIIVLVIAILIAVFFFAVRPQMQKKSKGDALAKKYGTEAKTKVFGIRWIVWIAVMAFLLWAFGDVLKDPYVGTMYLLMFIIVGFGGLMLCLIPNDLKKKKARKEAVEKGVECGDIAVASANVRHVGGLPVPGNIPCEVTVFANRLEMQSSSQKFRVPMERVIGAESYVDTEMRQHIKRNTGGAIVGGLIFGGAGAIVGGMPESRYQREISKFNLLVNYLTPEGTVEAVIFTSERPIKQLAKGINEWAKAAMPVTTTEL